MTSEFDMHDAGAALTVAEDRELSEGLLVAGRVVCHHPFGLGAYVEAHDQYGHVNVPEISDGQIRDVHDYPAIGAAVQACVLGYSGAQRQLRLTLRTGEHRKRE